MALSGTQAYALSKKYTEDTVIGLGALRGKPCTIKSTVHKDGVTTVTFEWVALQPDGVTEVKQETQIEVNDGTPIYVWTSGTTYKYGDLAIYNSCFYRCITENSDVVFDDTKWNEIGSPDGSYDIVADYSKLPPRFSAADRKMYYAISDYTVSGVTYLSGFYLWDGTKWKRTVPDVLDRFLEVPIKDSTGTITGYELYFDGKKVITAEDQDFQIVSSYTDIDTTKTKNVVYMVENPTYDSTDPTKVTHYSGQYLFDSTAKTVEYIDEKETKDIDFSTDYTPVIEG